MFRHQFRPKGKCFFCLSKIERVDYKDLTSLQKFISPRGRILPRTRSGVCAAHQRQLGRAIKRARELALLPYTDRHAI